jgi:lipid-A-disaccharide synthase
LEVSFLLGLINASFTDADVHWQAAPQGLKPKPSGALSGTAKAVPYPDPRIHLVPDALPALRHSRAAIVASGTATVEAALMETPFVMVYRVSPLTYALGKPRVKVPHFAMVNLIAGERIVPELVQRNFTGENVVTELGRIIPDGADRETMIRRLKSVREKLKRPDNLGESSAPASTARPSDRAAEIIMGMLK